MRFLILSDSHRQPRNIKLAVERAGKVDAIFFLGDGVGDLGYDVSYEGIPVFFVRGNCDFFSLFADNEPPEELFLTFDEYTVMLTHGHLFGVKSSPDAAAAYAAKKGADILLFGHTHKPFEKYLATGDTVGDTVLSKPLYVFNPGSIGTFSDGHYSFGTLTISKQGIIFAHGKI